MFRYSMPALAAALCLVTHNAEAREIRSERVHFFAGEAEKQISDRIVGYEMSTFIVHGNAGETLTVRLEASNPQTYFNVYAPGKGPGDQALANAGLTGEMVPDINEFSGELPETGDYTISVYMMRAAARRDEASDYTLDITHGGIETAQATDSSDTVTEVYGPDFYVVDVNSRLRLHETPSGSSEIVGHLYDGAVVHNLGCEQHSDRTWCDVEQRARGLRGWAAAEYLMGDSGAVTSSDHVHKHRIYGHTHGWNVFVRDDMENGCMVERTRDGVQVQIGFDPATHDSYLAAYARDHDMVEAGEHTHVQFFLDGDSFVGDAVEQEIAGFEGGYAHFNNPRFLTDLADKHQLTVMPAGRAPFTFDLTGSKAAIHMMIECQLVQP